MRRFTVVLADIDGTLLHADGAGRRAFQTAFRETFSVGADLAKVDFAGATDLGILAGLLASDGRALSREDVARFFERLERDLAEALAGATVTAVPGASPLVRKLTGRSDVALGLLTGNARRCARLKLAAAGFDPGWFRFGGYGDEFADRCDIARAAVDRAPAPAGVRRTFCVLGDTPADVGAARAIGARALTVAGVRFSRVDLVRAGADLVVDDLNDTNGLEAWICEEGGRERP